MAGKGTKHKDRLQRNCYQALNDGDRFLSNLLALQEAFEPHHPEYLPLLYAIGEMVIMAQSSLGDFFKAAWGRRPPEFPGGETDTDLGGIS